MAFKSLKKLMIGGVVAMAAITGMASQLALASGGGGHGEAHLETVEWSFKGPFGTFDRAAAQRGYQVFREVCSNCHGLKYLSFRHLGDRGAPFEMEDYPNPNDNPYVKNFAADWVVEDIDGETGDVIERKAVPADSFPPRYPNAAAARAANGGGLPPDLSNIINARGDGANYVYNLLISYDAPKPKDVELTPGLYWNPVMSGGKIAMAPPLFDGVVEYEPVTVTHHGKTTTIAAPEANLHQVASDVVQFLAWASDPKMEQRKSTGLMSLIFLVILSLLLYLSYKRVWRDVAH